MLLIGAAVGVVAGLVAGGHLRNLLSVQLRYGILIITALVLRFTTQWLLGQGVGIVDDLRVALFATAFGMLVVALWLNRSQPGMLVAMVGVALNGIAIVVNGGYMPVYLPALEMAGLTEEALSPTLHKELPADLGLDFLLAAGPLGDIIPIGVPLLATIISVGDILLAAGVAWFLFSAIVRGSDDPDRGVVSLWNARPQVSVPRAATSPGLTRQAILGSGSGPPTAAEATAASVAEGTSQDVEPQTLGQRLREHPYVRLARDSRFSTFWLAGTISLFGDRLHQVAIAVVVLERTGSPMQTGFVFLAATLPNLLLGPIAGTFVDRWDQKLTMIVSDLLRAGLVITLPFVVWNDGIWLVYPIVFLITAISVFFRPAKAAIIPRIVRREDLTPANGAMWTGETMADIAGFPLAGLFIGVIGIANVALAFWIDAMTYLISAILLAGLVIPPAARIAAQEAGNAIAAFIEELRDGWHFLRREAALFQNTMVSVLAQLSIGTTLALMVVYAERTLSHAVIPYPENYAIIEAAIGLGNLVGGFVVGAVGAQLRKGWLVITGFAFMGLATIVLGLTTNVGIAILAAMVIGIFNLVYIVPSQTLFAERTPSGLMGRVVAIRGTIVLGSLTGAMAVSALFAEVVDAGAIIAFTGVLTVAAAILAAWLPAVRDA